MKLPTARTDIHYTYVEIQVILTRAAAHTFNTSNYAIAVECPRREPIVYISSIFEIDWRKVGINLLPVGYISQLGRYAGEQTDLGGNTRNSEAIFKMVDAEILQQAFTLPKGGGGNNLNVMMDCQGC